MNMFRNIFMNTVLSMVFIGQQVLPVFGNDKLEFEAAQSAQVYDADGIKKSLYDAVATNNLKLIEDLFDRALPFLNENECIELIELASKTTDYQNCSSDIEKFMEHKDLSIRYIIQRIFFNQEMQKKHLKLFQNILIRIAQKSCIDQKANIARILKDYGNLLPCDICFSPNTQQGKHPIDVKFFARKSPILFYDEERKAGIIGMDFLERCLPNTLKNSSEDTYLLGFKRWYAKIFYMASDHEKLLLLPYYLVMKEVDCAIRNFLSKEGKQVYPPYIKIAEALLASINKNISHAEQLNLVRSKCIELGVHKNCLDKSFSFIVLLFTELQEKNTKQFSFGNKLVSKAKAHILTDVKII